MTYLVDDSFCAASLMYVRQNDIDSLCGVNKHSFSLHIKPDINFVLMSTNNIQKLLINHGALNSSTEGSNHNQDVSYMILIILLQPLSINLRLDKF